MSWRRPTRRSRWLSHSHAFLAVSPRFVSSTYTGIVSETSLNQNGAIRWTVTGATRRGESHVKAGSDNQDAVGFLAADDGAAVILAVADGHGSDIAFRSGAGSRLAVNVTVRLLGQFAQAYGSGASAAPITERALTALSEKLTGAWSEAVRRHMEAKPITRDEWVRLAELRGVERQHLVVRHPTLAYGSTLLGAVATQTYILSVQLGDGDILLVDARGRGRRIIPHHDRMPALTPSLAQQGAANNLHLHVQNATDGLPSLILAATDGYTESFRVDHEFVNVGSQYLEAARTEGVDAIDRWLERFLEEARTRGSEDDITVGLIARLD